MLSGRMGRKRVQTEDIARIVCSAWGHCAGGCPLRGEPCKGQADALLHDWQGRVARAVETLIDREAARAYQRGLNRGRRAGGGE
jgi:hypothetical protein